MVKRIVSAADTGECAADEPSCSRPLPPRRPTVTFHYAHAHVRERAKSSLPN